MRLGILGGAFNPPHLGHLICAQEAHSQLELDRVVFMPVGQAPHRTVEQDPGADVRARLCELACAGDPRFSVSRLELERAGPSYTVETLQVMSARSPDDELTLILGADQASRLPSWHEPEKVLGLARLAVATREGVAREAVLRELDGLALGARIAFFDMPRLDISSSFVRDRAASGRPIRYLVPQEVGDYVRATGLYGTSTAVGAG